MEVPAYGTVTEVGSPRRCRSSRIGRPAIPRYRDVHPRAVVQCASTRDVARAVAYARVTGTHVVPRGGGHCFAGRSSTKGLMLDLGRLDTVTVNVDGLATIGAGRAAGPGVRRTARARADHPSRLRPDGRHRRTHRGRRARPARSPARADLRCAGRRTGRPRRRTTRRLRRGSGARAVLGASRRGRRAVRGVVTSLVFATVPEPLWQCSLHRDDDLAFGASLVDVGQGFLGGLERKDTVDDGADDA